MGQSKPWTRVHWTERVHLQISQKEKKEKTTNKLDYHNKKYEC